MAGATPQFGKAEYLGQASPADRCRFCQQPIATQYFRVNGALTCPGCAEKAKLAVPQDEHAAFVRALLFGAGAALAGFVLYAAFAIVTGWMIGYISLAVGYMIGKAMIFGSKGLGGKRYQIAAVLLTYAAVSMAAIPIAMAQYSKVHKLNQAPVQSRSAAQGGSSQQTSSSANPNEPAAAQPASAPHPTYPQRPRPSAGKVIGALVLLGLASPFLELGDPVHGFIGLIILFVGLQIAWKLTAGRSRPLVDGPFDNPAPKPL